AGIDRDFFVRAGLARLFRFTRQGRHPGGGIGLRAPCVARRTLRRRVPQRDHRFSRVQHLRPLLSLLLSHPPADWIQQRSMPYLRNWDLRYDAGSVGAGIYEVVYWRLVHRTLDDELGPGLVDSYLQWFPEHRSAMEELARQPASPWFDDLSTLEPEDRDRIVAESLAEGLDWLGRRFGDLPYEWNWGRVHHVSFRHPLGERWPLTILLNRGAMRASGATECVSVTQPLYGRRMVVGSLPAYRLIVDLGRGEALSTLATGQSGNPVSPHYGDRIGAWREGRYHPLPYEHEAVLEARVGAFTLAPAP
ncbi:MAG: penicillin acylase family protein, partial [Anaerolineae bacterium]|nr:penicillin acylase family protein [Anaerolineae bacterium]